MQTISNFANLALMLAVVLVGFGALLTVALRLPRAFLAAIMIWYAVESTHSLSQGPLLLKAASFNVLTSDVILVVTAAAAVLRIRATCLEGLARAAALVLTALVFCGTVSYVALLGLQTGVNDWRWALLPIALVAYVSTVPRPWTWRDLNTIIVLPACVAALGDMVFVFTEGLGSASHLAGSGISRPGLDATMVLAGFWVVLMAPSRRLLARALLAIFLGGVVVLIQQRAAWVAALAGGVAWMLARQGHTARLSSPLARITAGVLGLIAIAAVVSSVPQLAGSAVDDNTFQWRLGWWADSLETPRSPVQWLVGSAFGPTPITWARLMTPSAHSLYVTAVEYVGLIGLVAVLILFVRAASARLGTAGVPIGSVVIVSFMAYSIFYSPGSWTWIVVGIMIAIRQQNRAGPGRAPIGKAVGRPTPEEDLAATQVRPRLGSAGTVGRAPGLDAPPDIGTGPVSSSHA